MDGLKIEKENQDARVNHSDAVGRQDLPRDTADGDVPSLAGIVIEWNENPLRSAVRLDAHGLLRLKYGIAIDAIQSAVVLIDMDARDKPPKKGRWVDQFEFIGHGDGIDSEIERQMAWSVDALLDLHCGDCTCVPASCMKCHAEEMLGIFTTEGLGKHPGHYVQSAFNAERTTLAHAIHHLRTDPIKADWKGWEAHVPRWTQERNEAIEWLEAYGITHGFSLTTKRT